MKYALIDYRTSEEEIMNLRRLGCEILTVPPSNVVYEAVCGHPDILMNIIDKNSIIVHKDMDVNFVKLLKELNLNIYFSDIVLGSTYPQNIILNAVIFPHLFVHNTKHTDPKLLQLVEHKKLINVKQGYSKCSTALVTYNAVMTSDKCIANTLSKENVDVLLLPPGDIMLPSLDYGFIGGCCGLINEHTLAFFGNLNQYAYGDLVLSFLEKHKVKPVYLKEGKLIDRGSLFIIDR